MKRPILQTSRKPDIDRGLAINTEATVAMPGGLNQKAHKVMLLAGLAALSCVIAFFANTIIPGFSVLFLCLSLSLLVAFMAGSNKSTVLYCGVFVFLGLSFFEFYSIYRNYIAAREYSGEVPREKDSELGWRTKKHSGKYPIQARMRFGEVVFDVDYTLDPWGLRVTPEDKTEGPVFFFGDSITFGWGVADHQAFPFVFSAQSRFHARNFAFGGYGPHQTLRMLELGIPRSVDARLPTYAVYTAIPDHIDRAAGRPSWNENGPLYQVLNGSVVHSGSTADNKRTRKLFSIVARSYVLSAFLKPALLWFFQTTDVERFVGIVVKMRDVVEQQHGSRFIFVYWDILPRSWGVLFSGNDAPRDKQIADHICRKLAAVGVRTIRLSERLPHIKEPSYYLAEGHPNGKAHAAVASMLLEELP